MTLTLDIYTLIKQILLVQNIKSKKVQYPVQQCKSKKRGTKFLTDFLNFSLTDSAALMVP